MKSKIERDPDLIRGAKAIAEFIGETPRQTYSLINQELVPVWKNGGGYVASRRQLQAYLDGEHLRPTKGEKDKAKRLAEFLEDQRRARAERKGLGGDADNYKRQPILEYVPPTSPLAKEIARLVVDEIFPRKLWERHYPADRVREVA